MFSNKTIKYMQIILLFLIIFISYKLIDNYNFFINIILDFISIITPFIYAFVFAYILNPIINLIQKKFKLNKNFSICLIYIFIILSIIIGLLFTIPSVIENIFNITKEIPSYIDIFQEYIHNILKNKTNHQLILESGILDTLQNIPLKLGDFAIYILQSSSAYLLSFTSQLVKIILGLLISIYVLIEKDSFLKNFKILIYMIFKEKNGSRIISFIKIYHNMIGTYISIKAIDSMIIGIIALIGTLILQVPHAPLIALIVAVTNMIPYFGPFIGEIAGAAIALFVSPVKAITVFILLLCIQQFDAWYLDPKLIGKKVGVSPLGIIFVVTIGGVYFGPIGMILASPTMATLKIYYNKILKKFLDNNQSLIKNNKIS